jgi:hypothetical protein
MEPLSREASEANHGALSDLLGAGPNMGTERLVALLLSEHPVSHRVRRELADALTGKSPVARMRLEPAKRNGHRDSTLVSMGERLLRDIRLGRAVMALQAEGLTYFEAVGTVAAENEVSEKLVEAALTRWRKFIRNAEIERASIEKAGGFEAWQAANRMKDQP